MVQNNEVCDRRILEKRTDRDLSNETLDAVRRMTYHMDTLPVGTFKYKTFKYPGDVDLFEKFELCCDFNTSRVEFSKIIVDITKNILSADNIIFSEFKAGYDKRFNIYIGNIENGHIVDYDPELIMRDIKNLYEANLLYCEEYEYFKNLITQYPEMENFLELQEALRNFWVLRWNSDEILEGYKVLRGNYKKYLDEAVTEGSIIKMDSIAYVDQRFVEVTNFFLVTMQDRYGNVSYFSEELGNYGNSLLSDFYKYYGTNTLKAIKRLWMYLILKKDICDLSLFKELFSSDIAFYSQIVADIEVVIDLLKSSFQYDRDLLLYSINKRLKMVDSCYDPSFLDNMFYMQDFDLIKTFEDINDCLKNWINQETLNWLDYNNIDIFDLATK